MLLIGIQQVVPRTLFGGMAAPLHIWINPAHYDPVMIHKTFVGKQMGWCHLLYLCKGLASTGKGKRSTGNLAFIPPP